MKMKSITGAVGLAALIGGTVIGPANAQLISLGVQNVGYNGGLLTLITSASATTGLASGGLTIGQFNFVSGSAYGEANNIGGFISSVTAALSTKQASSAVLDVYFTEQNLTGTTAFPLLSGLTANGLSQGWTVTESVYADAANGLFTTVDLLATGTFSASTASSANFATSWSGASPYSITEYYQITVATGYKGSAAPTETVSAGVPEVSTWMMMFAGFAGLGLVGFGRKRKAEAVEA